MKRQIAGVLVFLFMSIAVFAGEPVIIIADVDRGLALVPEGTVLPKGITVRVTRQSAPGAVTAAAEQVAETDAAPAAKPLVFAYAPESAFAEARAAIAKRPRFAIERQDVDWYYVYYWDGSHHAVRRSAELYNGYWYYDVYTEAYVTPNWDWYQSSASVSQSGGTYFNASNNCWFGTSGGTCACFNGVQTNDPNFYATVDSEAHVSRYRQSPCGIWGEPPCQEYFSSTISVSFP